MDILVAPFRLSWYIDKTFGDGAHVDSLYLVQFVQKSIKDRRVQVLELLENNGVKSMEQYQNLMGELSALNYVAQELSGLLEKQEQLND